MNNMKVSFVTTNKHKFSEVQEILAPYSIDLEHVDMEYDENHDSSMRDISTNASRMLANKLGKAVVVEDTGLYFEAYQDFPGALPKFVFNSLGYRGILKLLDEENRGAFFLAVVAYCEPGGEPQLFEGKMKGVITDRVFDEDEDVMPYERIFALPNQEETISRMSVAEKAAVSHRGHAFRKLGEFLSKK